MCSMQSGGRSDEMPEVEVRATNINPSPNIQKQLHPKKVYINS